MLTENDSLLDDFEDEAMKHPAYHLRTNKALDRLLLVDILRRLDFDHKEYTYFSFGGPFLEDLKVMDHFFPNMKLVSLETNEQTLKRQKFNKFSSRVDLQHKTLQFFLAHNYEPGAKDVFWLDYTDIAYARFEEFQIVLRKVLPGSVIRITLRAEPDINISRLRGRFEISELEKVRLSLETAFKQEYEKLLEQPFEAETFTSSIKYCRLIQLMLQRAASLALDVAGSQVEYLPIQCTRYRDDTQMITVTGVVCHRNQSDMLREILKTVRFANLDWHSPDLLDLPALSIKERLHLEPLLPVEVGEDAGEKLYNALEYNIDDNLVKSKKQLLHYADCQRDYPHFIRSTTL